MSEYLKIIKILNNNAVVCTDNNNTEKIVMGRGLAFQQKVGSYVDNNRIEKIFTLHNRETSNHFQQIIQDIPVEHILLAEHIISQAKSSLKKELHDSIYITLTDHISAALQRLTQNIVLKNPLLPSIKRLYPDEFDVALNALSIIKESTGVVFPEDEASFLALHFIGAELGPNNKKINSIVLTTEKIADIAIQYIQQDIDEDSISWQRFITHISFLIQRLLQGQNYVDKGDVPLFDIMTTTYPQAFSCVLKIKSFLESEFSCIIGKEEQSYLIIHISKLQTEYGTRIPSE